MYFDSGECAALSSKNHHEKDDKHGLQARSQDFLLGGAFQKKVDLCWGGGTKERLRRSLLGGPGACPREILKIKLSETAFRAF